MNRSLHFMNDWITSTSEYLSSMEHFSPADLPRTCFCITFLDGRCADNLSQDPNSPKLCSFLSQPSREDYYEAFNRAIYFLSVEIDTATHDISKLCVPITGPSAFLSGTRNLISLRAESVQIAISYVAALHRSLTEISLRHYDFVTSRALVPPPTRSCRHCRLARSE